MENLLSGIGRAFSESGGTTGWDSFTQADTLIVGLALATVVLLVLALRPRPPACTCRRSRAGRASPRSASSLVKFFDEPGAERGASSRATAS